MLEPQSNTDVIVWENGDESTVDANIQKDILREDTYPETKAEEL